LADGGEGKLDAQTVMGKAPQGVASIAKKYGEAMNAKTAEHNLETMTGQVFC